MGVTFERLPPERRVLAPSAASAGSCCCCCCCCLHTVGAMIGALTAKPPKPPDTMPTAVVGTDATEPNYKVTKEYWATVFILATVALPLILVLEGVKVEEPLAWALFYAVFFPAIQLSASFVVAIRNSFSKRPGKNQRLQHLGSITWRSFLGGLIGIVVMVVLFYLR